MSAGSTKRPAKKSALNLLPVMNLVTILIPLLLMTSQLVQIAVIDSTLPAIGEELEPSPPHDKLVTPSLLISRTGVVIQGAGDVLTPSEASVPCTAQPCATADTYDYDGVQDRLARVKDAHPDAEVVILVPDDNIPYEVLVNLMDASRQIDPDNLLFPSVTISGGVPG